MNKEVQPERFNEHTDTGGNTKLNNTDQSLAKGNQATKRVVDQERLGQVGNGLISRSGGGEVGLQECGRVKKKLEPLNRLLLSGSYHGYVFQKNCWV